MATKMVLACSHNRSLQLLARLDARTEFKILEHSLKGGWKLVVHITVGGRLVRMSTDALEYHVLS